MIVKRTLCHICTYNIIPEDEPSGSRHVEDIKNENISLETIHFVGLYCIILSKF